MMELKYKEIFVYNIWLVRFFFELVFFDLYYKVMIEL